MAITLNDGLSLNGDSGSTSSGGSGSGSGGAFAEIRQGNDDAKGVEVGVADATWALITADRRVDPVLSKVRIRGNNNANYLEISMPSDYILPSVANDWEASVIQGTEPVDAIPATLPIANVNGEGVNASIDILLPEDLIAPIDGDEWIVEVRQGTENIDAVSTAQASVSLDGEIAGASIDVTIPVDLSAEAASNDWDARITQGIEDVTGVVADNASVRINGEASGTSIVMSLPSDLVDPPVDGNDWDFQVIQGVEAATGANATVEVPLVGGTGGIRVILTGSGFGLTGANDFEFRQQHNLNGNTIVNVVDSFSKYVTMSADVEGADAVTLADVKAEIDGFSNSSYLMSSSYYGGADGTEVLTAISWPVDNILNFSGGADAVASEDAAAVVDVSNRRIELTVDSGHTLAEVTAALDVAVYNDANGVGQTLSGYVTINGSSAGSLDQSDYFSGSEGDIISIDFSGGVNAQTAVVGSVLSLSLDVSNRRIELIAQSTHILSDIEALFEGLTYNDNNGVSQTFGSASVSLNGNGNSSLDQSTYFGGDAGDLVDVDFAGGVDAAVAIAGSVLRVTIDQLFTYIEIDVKSTDTLTDIVAALRALVYYDSNGDAQTFGNSHVVLNGGGGGNLNQTTYFGGSPFDYVEIDFSEGVNMVPAILRTPLAVALDESTMRLNITSVYADTIANLADAVELLEYEDEDGTTQTFGTAHVDEGGNSGVILNQITYFGGSAGDTAEVGFSGGLDIEPLQADRDTTAKEVTVLYDAAADDLGEIRVIINALSSVGAVLIHGTSSSSLPEASGFTRNFRGDSQSDASSVGGPPITVSGTLPDAEDAEKEDIYAASASSDEGLTSAPQFLREGHVSIMTMRSDYLGNDREGFARYNYGPRPEERYATDSFHGGDFLGDDPVGLLGVVIEYTNGVVTEIFVEAATDGDGGLADFVGDNATSNIKIRYRPLGEAVWTETLTLDDSTTPRTNVKRWTKNDDLEALDPPPVSMHHHGGSDTSAQWEIELLNADDDVVIEMTAGSFLEGVDQEWVHEQIADNWRRTINQIADQIGRKIVDITETHHVPDLTSKNYNAIFVDWSIPRAWAGLKETHASILPTGVWDSFTDTNFLGSFDSNPAKTTGDLFKYYYNKNNHTWRFLTQETHTGQTPTLHWINADIQQSVIITDVIWMGERPGRHEATLQVEENMVFDDTKVYLFFNTNNQILEELTNADFVSGTNQFNTYTAVAVWGGAGVETTNTTTVLAEPKFWFSNPLNFTDATGTDAFLEAHTDAIPDEAEWLLLNGGAPNALPTVRESANWYWIRVDTLPIAALGEDISSSGTLYTWLIDFAGNPSDQSGVARRDFRLAKTIDNKFLIATDNTAEDAVDLTVYYSYGVNIGITAVPKYYPISAANVEGTANAIELTTGSGLSVLAGGDMFWFLVESDNTGVVTLEIDGITAKDLQKISSSGSYADLDSGDLSDGNPVLCLYDAEADVLYILHTPVIDSATQSSGVLLVADFAGVGTALNAWPTGEDWDDVSLNNSLIPVPIIDFSTLDRIELAISILDRKFTVPFVLYKEQLEHIGMLGDFSNSPVDTTIIQCAFWVGKDSGTYRGVNVPALRPRFSYMDQRREAGDVCIAVFPTFNGDFFTGVRIFIRSPSSTYRFEYGKVYHGS